jgi:hypothetical protein
LLGHSLVKLNQARFSTLLLGSQKLKSQLGELCM